jgi:Ser/Thr protein kinase RdoA (MazF antagonist)
MKLDPSRQIKITQENIAKIVDFYSIHDFTFTIPEDGISNTTLIIESGVKKFILRVYRKDGKKDDDINLEIEFQDYLKLHHIPVPEIYKNKNEDKLTIVEIDGANWQCVFMEFIEGQNITVKPSHELISELAHIQAKMHLLGVEFVKAKNINKYPFLHLSDSLASKIENIHFHKDNKKVLDFIERVKVYKYDLNLDLPYGYNHLDIDFDGNVITKNNRIVGIIDFDDLRSSPPIMCLGYTLWNILDEDGFEIMLSYLKEYEKIRPLNSLEHETLPHVIFFRNYVIGIIRLMLWKENTPIEDIDNILKLEKEIPLLFR